MDPVRLQAFCFHEVSGFTIRFGLWIFLIIPTASYVTEAVVEDPKEEERRLVRELPPSNRLAPANHRPHGLSRPERTGLAPAALIGTGL